ncbi:PTIP binding protein Pa1 isoform X2 [Tachypleus tridentatus]
MTEVGQFHERGQEDWKVSCSDEEKYFGTKEESVSSQNWEPKAEDIVRLYNILDKRGIIELEWHCPGRRSPSVHSNESESIDRRMPEIEDSKQLEPNEFDFDDDGNEVTTPKVTPRHRSTPGSSAQKRVARLEKVMLDIRRHRRLDELEGQTPKKGSNNNLENIAITAPAD